MKMRYNFMRYRKCKTVIKILGNDFNWEANLSPTANNSSRRRNITLELNPKYMAKGKPCENTVARWGISNISRPHRILDDLSFNELYSIAAQMETELLDKKVPADLAQEYASYVCFRKGVCIA